METWGNTKILKLEKTAFLCSRKCSASAVLKSYDWAKKQRELGNCVVCGNHSKIEKDVFEIVLKGTQPLILVLARGIKTRWNTKIRNAVNDSRLLIISPFGPETTRVSRTTAEKRNKLMIEISNLTIIGYKTANGQLDKLLNGKHYEHL